MKGAYGSFKQWLLFILGLAITALWVIFCFNAEIDRSGDLVLSSFFPGMAVSVWVFLGAGFILFFGVLSLFIGLVRFLEDERTIHFRDKIRSKKLNRLTVFLGLLIFIALLAMILGAIAVLLSQGSDPNRPGTIYYYYYY